MAKKMIDVEEAGKVLRLRERCALFLSEANRRAISRVGNPVDELLAFVIAEKGRSADVALGDALPLCLYFSSAQEREEFVEIFKQEKPNVITKEMP